MPSTTVIVTNIINIGLYTIGFFLFKYNDYKNGKNSILTTLMMYICFFQSVLSFSFLPILFNFEELYQRVNMENIMQYFSFGLNLIHYQSLYKLNCGFNSATLTTVLLLESFYCIETILLLKNPISDFSIRTYLYFFFGLIMVGISFITGVVYFEVNFNASKHANNDNYEIFFFFYSMCFNIVTYFLFGISGVFSIVFIINFLRSQSQFYSAQKKFFGFRHIFYVICNIALWFYPFFELVIKGEECNSDRILLYINLFWFLLWTARMSDLNKILTLCIKDAENEPIVDIITEEQSANSSVLEKSIELSGNRERFVSIDTKVKTLLIVKRERSKNELIASETTKDNSDSIQVTQHQTLSSILQSNFLMEYMFYILHGIMNISELSDKHSGLYRIESSSSKEIATHQFKEIDNTFDNFADTKEIKIETQMVQELGLCGNFLFWLKSLNGSILLIEYGPKLFRNILKIDGLNYEEIKESFNIKKNEKTISSLSLSEGKSGSFFFFTYDKKFIIKTISERELKTFVNSFLNQYYEFISENNHTLLVRTYGVYTLCYGLSRVNVILMENVTPIHPNKILWKFDLKGSLKGRKTKNINFDNRRVTLKDRDFLDLKALKSDFDINFEHSSLPMIFEMFSYDTKLLRNNKLMDYSFFLTVCKNEDNYNEDNIIANNYKRCYLSDNKKYLYFISIIDYLTIFDRMKSFEHSVKSILDYKNRKTISAVNPLTYEERFTKFIMYNIFNIKTFTNYRARKSATDIKAIYE